MDPARFRAAHHRSGQRRADALALKIIAHHQAKLGIAIVARPQVTERHDLGVIPAPQLGEERQPPLVVAACQQIQHRVGEHGHRRKESQVPRARTQARVELADRILLASPHCTKFERHRTTTVPTIPGWIVQ